jgi:DNA-binding transcriptional regulator LsrR (DeoR family)
MARLRRATPSAYSDDSSLRLRAAWLYHAHNLTQNEVAERLGIGRSTIIRLLEEAKKRGEVRIWIEEGEGELVELALELEHKLGLDEAIVVPASDGFENAAKSVGLALGKFLSDTIADNMTIGVGWGRTLTASLASFHPPHHAGIKVMSLLGGSVETKFSNPVEFAWRIAGALRAECYLFPAPLVVDSAATKRVLIERCGLEPLYRMAGKLDLAVISAGDINRSSTSLVRHLVAAEELEELVELGCVGDVMCNFLDAEGNLLRHPLNDRVMSVDLDTLRTAEHIVLASGGEVRAPIIHATIKRLGCHSLVTDESAARALLQMGGQGKETA